MDDESLVTLLWERSETALSALSVQYGALVYRICLNITRSEQDARECVNDTYFAVWNRIPPNRPSPLSAFICRIGRNIALNCVRNRRAQKRSTDYEVPLDELADCVCGGDLQDALDARILGQCIDRFLETQTEENRVIFLRRYWFGDSVNEIAALLGLRENTVSVRLNRLRGRLKAYLIKEGIDFDEK